MKHTHGLIRVGYYNGIKDEIVAVVRHDVTKQKMFKVCDISTGDSHANAERLELIWNAANCKTNEEVVSHLEHTPALIRQLNEAVELLKISCSYCHGEEKKRMACEPERCRIAALFADIDKEDK